VVRIHGPRSSGLHRHDEGLQLDCEETPAALPAQQHPRAAPRASHRWARSFFGAFFGDLALRTSTSPAQSQNLTIHIVRLCSRKRLESRAACHNSPTRLLARLCAKTCPHSSALQPRREMSWAPSSSFQFLPVPSSGAGAYGTYGMSPDREASSSARSSAPACISLPIPSIAVFRTKSRASLSAHLPKVSKITDTRHRTSSSVPGRHLSRNSTQTDIIGKFHKASHHFSTCLALLEEQISLAPSANLLAL
jgi:hypothetical protein